MIPVSRSPQGPARGGSELRNPNVVVSSSFGPMIVNVNDAYIGASIIQTGYWSVSDITLLSGLLNRRKPKDAQLTFYDVGANIGTHTLALASIFRSRLTIRSFEAQRNIFHMLCGNVALNNLTGVHCHHAAVSEREGEEITFRVPDYTARNNLGGLELMPPVISDNQALTFGAAETVRTLCLDTFNEPVDLIKLDIEGMEDKALRGAAGTIAQHRPFVFAETGKTDRDFVLRFFRERSYAAYERNADVVFLPQEANITLSDARRMF